MLRLYKPITLLTVILLFSCSQNNEKTEIRFQVSDAAFLYQLTNETKDTAFLEAFSLAKEIGISSSEEFVDVLNRKLIEKNPGCQLSSYFSTFELKDKINFNTDNQQVIAVLKEELKTARSVTIEVIKSRIMSSLNQVSFLSGIFNKPAIDVKELDKNTYILTVNRKLDKNRYIQLLESQADLGFWETYKLPEVFDFLRAANTKIVELGVAEMVKEDEKKPVNENDNELMNIVQKDSTEEKWAKENPLFRILNPSVNNDGTMRDECSVGISKISDTALVNKYLSLPEINALFPQDLWFLWESRPNNFNPEYINLIAIKITNRDRSAPINGSYIVKAAVNETNGMSFISMNMNAEGAKIWSRMTRENINKQIAIVFNGSVYSYPMVMSEIKEGRSEISGNFTPDEAADLATILNSGQMPNIGVKVIEILEK